MPDLYDLPDEVVSYISYFCDPISLAQFAIAYKTASRVVINEQLWQEKLRIHFPFVWRSLHDHGRLEHSYEEFKKAYKKQYDGVPQQNIALLSAIKGGDLRRAIAIYNSYESDSPYRTNPRSICDRYGRDMAFWAAANGHTHILDWLVSIECAPCPEDDKRYNRIFENIAAQRSDGLRVDDDGKVGATPLQAAAIMNQPRTIEWYHRHNLPIDTEISRGTPLSCALAVGSIDAISCLHRLGVDFHKKDQNGLPIVFHAVIGKNAVAVLEWLSERGIPITEKTSTESSIMHFAAHTGNVPALLWLRSHNTDHTAKNTENRTPIQYFQLSSLCDTRSARLLNKIFNLILTI